MNNLDKDSFSPEFDQPYREKNWAILANLIMVKKDILVLKNKKIKNAVVVHKSILITFFQVTISNFYLLVSFVSITNKSVWDK